VATAHPTGYMYEAGKTTKLVNLETLKAWTREQLHTILLGSDDRFYSLTQFA